MRERAWLLSRCRTTETVTLSRVALGGRIPAVYDQRYTCHNLRDGGRRSPATMLTTPRMLPCQQQAYGSESRFLSTQPAFDAPVKGGGVLVGVSPPRLVRKH